MDAAVKFARGKANPKPTTWCARYVMAAIARGFDAISADTISVNLRAGESVELIEKKWGVTPTIAVPGPAKDFGPVFEKLGFKLMKSVEAKSEDEEDFAFNAGDVIVFGATTKNEFGHAQIFDGSKWISDFEQYVSIWPARNPASAWNVERPAYKIYRFSPD